MRRGTSSVEEYTLKKLSFITVQLGCFPSGGYNNVGDESRADRRQLHKEKLDYGWPIKWAEVFTVLSCGVVHWRSWFVMLINK